MTLGFQRGRGAVGRSPTIAAWVVNRGGTIRGQIFLALLAMSIITVALGGYATVGIRRAGMLVENTFDKSLMSINYARAAAADLALMQAALTRWWTLADAPEQQELDARIEKLGASLKEDLAIAAERSQSERAARAAASAQESVDAWQVARQRLLAEPKQDELWHVLDQNLAAATRDIERLINYTSGDGFIYRQRAKGMVAADRKLTLVATAAALVFSAVVVWLLARRITRPVAAASMAARRIAAGNLDGDIPRGGADELGALLVSMSVMRDKIRAMMDQEVAQRERAELRLADALESSREGFIVEDADGRIALANARAREFLGDLRGGSGDPAVLSTFGQGPNHAGEVQVNGRWLRISRSATSEGGSIVVCSDLTALKDHETRREASLSWLDAALGNIAQGLCLYDAESRLQVVNARFCEIFGLSPEQVIPGLELAQVLDMCVTAGNYAGRRTEDLLAEEMRAHDTNGPRDTRFMELTGGRVVAVARQRLADGGWVATFEDITERRKAEDQIVHMARHDALTNLPNRNLLAERIEQALAQSGRDGKLCAVLFLDLDRFKAVNDTLGHPVGDELLCAVAERLQSCVREVDTVARMGGDEFAVVQYGLEKPEDAAVLARRIVQVLGQPYEILGHHVVISTSIGISVAPIDGNLCGKLLKNADMALYKAKGEGRATWRFFEPEMDARLQARRALEADFREALAGDKLELHYQPIFDIKKQRVGGFEALLRWRDPGRGMVPPSEFVPIAEEIGLIVPLGDWVLKRACAQASLWPGHIKVAVNVSPAQFAHGDLLHSVQEALALSGLPAGRLELEITESVLLTDSASTLAILHALRKLGARISMDDFGTGYSSLSYLRRFAFDKIKIDQSFIRDLNKTEDAAMIVRTIIGLGGSLGMRITAEGVETKQQFEWLRAEGCTEAQGYLFSAAKPASDVSQLADANRFASLAA